jgi:hypothetical protein
MQNRKTLRILVNRPAAAAVGVEVMRENFRAVNLAGPKEFSNHTYCILGYEESNFP